MTNQTRNEVLLEGIPVGAPEPSHENHGQLFYRQILEVPRLSGTADRLPLLVRQMQLPLLKEGTSLRVEGQLRSFNNRSRTASRVDGVRPVPSAGAGRAGQPHPAGRDIVQAAYLPADAAGPQHQRSDLSRAPELRPGGLPALYRLGDTGPALRQPGGG